MSSTYSPDLRIELIGTGDQAGVWGNTTNNNLGTFIENAVAGYTSVSVIASPQALTANDGAADEARFAVIALTTTTAANFTVCIPPNSKLYTFYNASSYTATISNSTVKNGVTLSGGTTVAIPTGKTMSVWSDGTNVAQQTNHLISPTIATPTMTAPVLGTPASGTLTNATGLPIVDGTTGTLSVARGGTGVTTSTGSGNVVLSTSPTLVTPVLGTPASGNLANCTFPTLNQNTSGNAATATAPQSGGSFITSSNIASQSVTYATSAGSTPINTSAIGYGQTWTDVSGSRALSATYTNDTGKPIMLVINAQRNAVSTATLNISVNGGSSFQFAVNSNSGGGNSCSGSIVIPIGQTYNVTSPDAFLVSWWELR